MRRGTGQILSQCEAPMRRESLHRPVLFDTVAERRLAPACVGGRGFGIIGSREPRGQTRKLRKHPHRKRLRTPPRLPALPVGYCDFDRQAGKTVSVLCKTGEWRRDTRCCNGRPQTGYRRPPARCRCSSPSDPLFITLGRRPFAHLPNAIPNPSRPNRLLESSRR